MSTAIKLEAWASGVDMGKRKRSTSQKLVGELFARNEKRRATEDNASRPSGIGRRVVQPKGRGRRRTSDWCTICMDEYGFLSINDVIGDECCGKKITNCNLFPRFMYSGNKRK